MSTAFSFHVFRRFFADGDGAKLGKFVNRKNFAHKLTTTLWGVPWPPKQRRMYNSVPFIAGRSLQRMVQLGIEDYNISFSRISRASSIISTTISAAGLISLMDLTPAPAGIHISSKSPVVSVVGSMALNFGMS